MCIRRVLIHPDVLRMGTNLGTMLNLCEGHARKRFVLASTRFYSDEELIQISINPNRILPLYLEYGPNLYQEIESLEQLRFVCRMVSQDHASYISDDDYTQHKLDTEESAHTAKYERTLLHPRKTRVKRCSSAPIKTPSMSLPKHAMTRIEAGIAASGPIKTPSVSLPKHAMTRAKAGIAASGPINTPSVSLPKHVMPMVEDGITTSETASGTASKVVTVSNDTSKEYQRVRGSSGDSLLGNTSTSSIDEISS
jgi:hypothetical protein